MPSIGVSLQSSRRQVAPHKEVLCWQSSAMKLTTGRCSVLSTAGCCRKHMFTGECMRTHTHTHTDCRTFPPCRPSTLGPSHCPSPRGFTRTQGPSYRPSPRGFTHTQGPSHHPSPRAFTRTQGHSPAWAPVWSCSRSGSGRSDRQTSRPVTLDPTGHNPSPRPRGAKTAGPLGPPF